MKIITRYIAKTVILMTLLVMAILAGLSYIIILLTELKDIGSGDYGFLEAALHAILELPYNVYQFFPMVVLLGGLLGLGTLASNQELIIMRASGVSTKKIMYSVLSSAFILIIMGIVIGELLAPKTHYLADMHKSIAQSSGQAVKTTSGLWVHEGSDFLHIGIVANHKHLEKITRYQFDVNHKLIATYFANALDYKNKKWVVSKEAKTTFLPERTVSQHSEQSIWDLTLNPTILSAGMVAPEEMSLNRLWFYTKHLVKNGMQATEFQFSFWKRVLRPITILIMLFLAIPFIFATPRSKNMGWRILLGIIIGFLFYLLDSLLGQLSVVFQLSPFLAALFPILLFAGLGYTVMFSLRKMI